jgi:hypothetical protein
VTLFSHLLLVTLRAIDDASPAYGRVARSALETYNAQMREINGR